ncbi:peptide-methionine (R)-S-oxide reductase MsrB [Acetobacteraceae bacterium]|nr:peptide-methionine (R)-S-oxide reductase MsrB [Acetobacteraceae bacterium]
MIQSLDKRLSPAQAYILKERGTEPPYSSCLIHEKREGAYHCAGCGAVLFYSTQKYESGCGWPSFYEEVAGAVEKKEDTSLGMRRTEITCAKCHGHLGHLFPDGPQPTGLRYCTNGLSLDFVQKPMDLGKTSVK